VTHPRCAGIDVAKKDAKVCVRVQGSGRRPTKVTVTTWGAMSNQILTLREHLINEKVTCVDTETKLIHHAIRIAAYNTAQSLACAIVTDTGYTRADDEAHSVIRTALAGSGDIIPDTATNTLHVRLDPLPAPRHTVAIDELCRVLNDTHTVYPGTGLTLRYSIKSHR